LLISFIKIDEVMLRSYTKYCANVMILQFENVDSVNCIICLLTQSRHDRTALNHDSNIRAGLQSNNLFVI